ncbi:MAG: agmatine deiminase family protein [Candidatus Cloacimonetes bacterium]|nr:agmatine deiminase family protein [Candidatus Cloacimonadota bacterium]
MRFRLLTLFSLIIIAGSLFAHNYEPVQIGYAWDSRFTETPAPSSPVRPIAEFEPASHVLIRYPLGIPTSLVVQLSNTADVICFVNSSSTASSASNSFNSAGVNMERVSFMIAETDSYWTRDFGPWFIYDGNGDYAVVDFRYNRPRPNDNMIPQLFAQEYDLTYYGMSLYQTGGNYMTDGINTAAQTDIAYSENSNNQANVNTRMQDYLGISSYHVLDDPNNTYIDHIDCWGKFLAPDKVLIRSVPSSHAQYGEIEATAAYFAAQNCAWGYPYKVYRVNTPSNQPYTNSLILNKKVFVPQMGSANDAAALQVYRDAMPGYEVIGVSGSYNAPWESTDALHCRTHEVPDAGMLHIAHQPLWGMQAAGESYEISADIIAHSGDALYADSLFIRYQINGGDWQYLPLLNTTAMHYANSISTASVGDTIRYYLYAADQSGRRRSHPEFAELDPHLFVIEGDATAPVLEHNPITSISNAETTFILIANDPSGITDVEFSYRIDGGEIITLPMLDAGNNMYLLLLSPDFPANASIFEYRISAEDSFGNIANLPSAEQWYSVSILPTANADLILPSIPALRIYPNPARSQDAIHIAFTGSKSSPVQIQIFNLRGQLIFEETIPSLQQPELIWSAVENNGQKLGSGIYFVRASNGQEVSNHKLIITK